MNAEPECSVTYSVVVRDPNSWDASTGIHYLLRDCGHRHKTALAADRCAAKLLNYTCQHGEHAGVLCSGCCGRARRDSHSGYWHLCAIERSDGVTVIVDQDSGSVEVLG
jgi:hypothetical protein